jgi:hypothetical protein
VETIKPGKTVLSSAEVDLLLDGLSALARENRRMSEDAQRLGYAPEAAQLRRQADEVGAFVTTARLAGIEKITVRHAI